MNDRSASETLVMALPVLLVLLALIGAIIFFPQGSILDIRGKAAPIIAIPTRIPVPTAIATPTTSYHAPENVCPDLYKPVCNTKTGTTYGSQCEAKLAGALPVKVGKCPKAASTKVVTPAAIPLTY